MRRIRKWQWLALRFLTLPVKKRVVCRGALLKLICVLAFGSSGVRADESVPDNRSAKHTFDGTYTIHMSESARIQNLRRPEPGYFDKLVIELFKSAGLDFEIVLQMPWKRQMESAEREIGHVIYPTTRIDHREDVFQWVGPVSRTFWNLYGFEESSWTEIDFETLMRDARIGVLLGSARQRYLRERGAQNLVMVPREELLLPMLMADRVDLVAIGGTILRHYVDHTRITYPDETVPDVVGSEPYRTCYLYIAISGDVPKDDVNHLQTQLDTFKTNGFFVENRRMHGLSTDTESSFLRAMLDLDNNGIACVDLGRIGP